VALKWHSSLVMQLIT